MRENFKLVLTLQKTPFFYDVKLIMREFSGWEYSMTESKCKLIMRKFIGWEYSMNEESKCFLSVCS